MKLIKPLLVFAIMCVPVLASAQGYQGRGSPVRGGFQDRAGRMTLGFAIGLGGMHDDGSTITSCVNCDFKPLAFEADGHIGGMLSPRFGLMFEAQVNLQTVHSSFFGDDAILSQGAAMIAGQFWLLPQLWIKAGLGIANLQIDDSFVTEDFGSGGVLMGAIGVELLSARNLALELQARVIQGTYNSLEDNVTSGTIGFGVNWY
jgi:hypothetical protein